MKTVLLALGMTLCFVVGLACLHLMLNHKQLVAKAAKPKSSSKKGKGKPKQAACGSLYPKSICRLISKDGQANQVCYVIVPALFLFSLVIMLWLAFTWEG